MPYTVGSKVRDAGQRFESNPGGLRRRAGGPLFEVLANPGSRGAPPHQRRGSLLKGGGAELDRPPRGAALRGLEAATHKRFTDAEQALDELDVALAEREQLAPARRGRERDCHDPTCHPPPRSSSWSASRSSSP